MSASKPLTKRQQMVLHIICEWIVNYDYPPSIRQICATLGFRSPNALQTHLVALEREGYIRRESKRERAITVLRWPEYFAEPKQPLPLLGNIAAGNLREAIEDAKPFDWQAMFGSADRVYVVDGDDLQRNLRDGDYILTRPDGTQTAIVRWFSRPGLHCEARDGIFSPTVSSQPAHGPPENVGSTEQIPLHSAEPHKPGALLTDPRRPTSHG